MSPEKVTIVVLNWKQPEATILCLESLVEANLQGARILVVDNGSGDDSVEKIRARFPDQRVIALAENRGYAGGNNAGIRIALAEGAKGILLLNNDTRVLPDFLAPLLQAVDNDPPVAAVSSAILRMDRPEMLDVAYSVLDFTRVDAVRTVGVNALPGDGFDQRKVVEIAVGCSLLLTAEALRQIGLFDEEFFAYHEDVDWCLRAHRAGFWILYEPYSRVLHQRSASTHTGETPPARHPGNLPELANAEPLPWNPVRTYLGARNLIRIVRTYADDGQRWSYRRALLVDLPLKFLSIIKRREGWLVLGKWGYTDFFRQHFIESHETLRRQRGGALESTRRALILVVMIPFDLFVGLPADWWSAFREGRLAEFAEYLRGLRDGILDRPIPFERLGLR